MTNSETDTQHDEERGLSVIESDPLQSGSFASAKLYEYACVIIVDYAISCRF